MASYISLHIPSALCLSLHGDTRVLYFSLGIMSATGGLIGAISQLILWSRHLRRHDQRRKPSSNPHVVFSLALSNFIACTGSLVLVFFLLFADEHTISDRILAHSPRWHLYVVIPSQMLLNLGFIISWLWTIVYIADVCLQVYGYLCSTRIYHCIAWPLAATMALSCEMLRYHSLRNRHCSEMDQLAVIAILWTAVWSSIGVALVIGLVVLERKIKQDVYSVSSTFTNMERALYRRIRVKFLVFVAAFFICWLPTLLNNLVFLCDRKDDFKAELWVIEVVLNPLQGAINYFIFIPQTRLRELVPVLPGRKETALAQHHSAANDGFCHSVDSTANQMSCEDDNCLLGSAATRHRPTPVDSSFFHFTPHRDIDNNEANSLDVTPTESLTSSYESTASRPGTAYLVRLLGDEYPSL